MNPEISPAGRSVPEMGRRRRLIMAGGVVAVLFALYWVIGGAVLPRVARSMAETKLTELCGGPVRIERVSFHPFALRARVVGLTVDDVGGDRLLGWDKVMADLAWASVWSGEWRVEAVEIDGLTIAMHRRGDGGVNWLDLRDRVSKASASTNRESSAGSMPAFRVSSFVFTNGVVTVRDEVPQPSFSTRLEPIHFEVRDLVSKGGDGHLDFEARGDGGEVLSLSARLNVESRGVEGTVGGKSIALVKPTPYTDAISTLRPTAGTLAFEVPFRVSMGSSGWEAEVKEARLSLTDVAVVERDSGEPFAEVREIELSGLEASLTGREAALGRGRVEGGVLHVRRTPGKDPGMEGDRKPETNLHGLLRPEWVEELVRNLTDWGFRLGELDWVGCKVEFEDRTLEPATRLRIDPLGGKLTGVSNASNQPTARLETTLKWQGEDEVKVEAEGTLLPARARASVKVGAVNLQPLAPYLGQFLRLTLNRGRLSAELEAGYGRDAGETNGAAASAGGSMARVSGRVSIDDLAATEEGVGTDFIRWRAVEASGISVGLEPHRLELGELAVRQLQTSLILRTNGQLNVLGLIRQARELGEPGVDKSESDSSAPSAPSASVGAGRPEKGTEETADGPTAETKAETETAETKAVDGTGAASPFWVEWPIRVGKVKLEEVALLAADDFYGGGFRTSVESLDGEVRNLALPAEGAAEIDLKGRLTALSGFELAGGLTPDPAKFGADLKLTTRKADLTQFTPYVIRFAGYPITKGELTAQVHYRVEGDQLEASNDLLIDQFTLGPKTESPDAIQLPLKLGVALLRDAEGKIHLDVPLKGTLSDPEFRVAPLIWQAVRNVIVKAATAPFRLLGSLFGGGDEDLEYVEFNPGSVDLSAGMTNRLTSLVRGLNARPQLELEVLPAFSPEIDRPVLARARLERRLKVLRIEEIGASGAPLPDEAAVQLTSEDRARLIPVAYVREFGALPAGTSTNAPGTVAEPVSATPVGESAEATTTVAPATASGSGPERLETRLLETQPIPPEELISLARRRGEVVKGLLLAEGQLAPERVVLNLDETNHPGIGKARVTFRLQ